MFIGRITKKKLLEFSINVVVLKINKKCKPLSKVYFKKIFYFAKKSLNRLFKKCN